MLDKEPVSIKYLRHGPPYTGGARYEHWLASALAEKLNGSPEAYTTVSLGQFPRNTGTYAMLSSAWKEAKDSTLLLTVRRLLLSALLGPKKRHIVGVFHSLDLADFEKSSTRAYFRLTLQWLKKARPQNLSLVVVSQYWEDFFLKFLPLGQVFLIPNLFDTKWYGGFAVPQKTGRVILGQVASKNSPDLAIAAQMVQKKQLQPVMLYQSPELLEKHRKELIAGVEYLHLPFEEYLSEVAGARAMLALPAIHEGWPRMAHEAALVGTPVIGYKKGGLPQLLEESGNIAIDNIAQLPEALEKATSKPYRAPEDFVLRYDLSQQDRYLQPLLHRINQILP